MGTVRELRVFTATSPSTFGAPNVASIPNSGNSNGASEVTYPLTGMEDSRSADITLLERVIAYQEKLS